MRSESGCSRPQHSGLLCSLPLPRPDAQTFLVASLVERSRQTWLGLPRPQGACDLGKCGILTCRLCGPCCVGDPVQFPPSRAFTQPFQGLNENPAGFPKSSGKTGRWEEGRLGKWKEGGTQRLVRQRGACGLSRRGAGVRWVGRSPVDGAAGMRLGLGEVLQVGRRAVGASYIDP